jgi:hypothetical protein
MEPRRVLDLVCIDVDTIEVDGCQNDGWSLALMAAYGRRTFGRKSVGK